MNLKLAIQKSGRLYDDSLKLLKECGIEVNNSVKNQLKATAANFPMEIFFLRDDDIQQYVEDGVADIGFVGENVIYESQKNVETVEPLGFGKCRLSFAVDKTADYTGAEFLQGKKIATTYPVLVKKFLDEKNIKADIHVISGSVEIAPSIGLADAVCDLVSSGSTLFMNGLKEAEIIFQSQAALIKTPNLPQEKQNILDKLLFRIQTVKQAKNKKYVLMNAPNEKINEIVKALPGMKSPTVLPLALQGWCSIHTVLSETEFWQHVEEIKAIGAEDILVLPIEKMVI